MRLKKFLAKLFVIVSTFFVVLSPIVLVEEAHHNCVHDDCPICEVIRTAKENTRQIKVAPTAAVVLCVLPLLTLLTLAIVVISKNIDFSTLVSLKTKLSN
jgi:uncharacterized membrane protein YecN with MAPEG domain